MTDGWQQDEFDAYFGEPHVEGEVTVYRDGFGNEIASFRPGTPPPPKPWDNEDDAFVEALRDALIKPVTLADAVTPIVVQGTAEDLAQMRTFDMPHRRKPRHHGDRRGVDTTGMDPAIVAELKKMGTRGPTPEQVRERQRKRDQLALAALHAQRQKMADAAPMYQQVRAVIARQTPGLIAVPQRIRHKGGSLPGPVPGSSLPRWLRWTIWAYAFPITVMVALLVLTWLGGRWFVRRMNAAAARLPD